MSVYETIRDYMRVYETIRDYMRVYDTDHNVLDYNDTPPTVYDPILYLFFLCFTFVSSHSTEVVHQIVALITQVRFLV